MKQVLSTGNSERLQISSSAVRNAIHSRESLLSDIYRHRSVSEVGRKIQDELQKQLQGCGQVRNEIFFQKLN